MKRATWLHRIHNLEFDRLSLTEQKPENTAILSKSPPSGHRGGYCRHDRSSPKQKTVGVSKGEQKNVNSLSTSSPILDTPFLQFLSGYYVSRNNPKPNAHPFCHFNRDILYNISRYVGDWIQISFESNHVHEKGIIHWIACQNESHQYMNPVIHGNVILMNACDYHMNYSRNKSAAHRLMDSPFKYDKDCYFDPGICCFHFPHHSIHATGYSIRNGGGRGSVIRSWKLEASKSMDGPWTVLSIHEEDCSFFNDVYRSDIRSDSFKLHSWKIPNHSGTKQFFSYFRLSSLNIHPMGLPHAFYISGFELYGFVKPNKCLCNPKGIMDIS